MNILHTISKPPMQLKLESVLNSCKAGDAILFIEDGVYYCLDEQKLKSIDQDLHCYGLKEDLNARGLSHLGSNKIETISYRGFVELCLEYDKVISWF